MVTREELATKYEKQYADLDAEFFETINVGTPKRERRRKTDKLTTDANTHIAEITQNYEVELATNGFEELSSPEKPPRDLLAEIDGLKARLAKLETKKVKVNGVA